MNILALEIGNSWIRAAVVNAPAGEIRGTVAEAVVSIDAPTLDAAEFPPTRLWQSLAATARSAVRQSGLTGAPDDEIAGIGLTAFTPGLVLLGKNDQPLTPIWTNLDRRARPAARQVWAHVGDEFQAATGNRPLPGQMSALTWRQQHSAEPYLSHRVHAYLHVNGWLAFHMTGVKAFDPANACYSGLFGTLTDQSWSGRWCDYFEVQRAWLPNVIDADATVGAVRADVAGELGVPAGIPVKLGAGPISAMLSAAQAAPGDVLHIVGKTQTLATIVASPGAGPRRLVSRLGVGPHFVHMAGNPIGKDALAWLHQLCFREQSEADFYARTIPQARGRDTRVSFDPPFLTGDSLEIDARRAALRDLELTTDRLDLLAAVLKANARRHGEALANLGLPGPPRRVFVVGVAVGALRQLIAEYENCALEAVDADPLGGVARWFAP